MLLEDLYTIRDKSSLKDSSVTHSIVLNKEHPIFKGHFPSHPILPGVVMLQLCKELLENHLDALFFISETSRVKFLAPVDPSEKNVLVMSQTFQQSTDSFNVKNNITFVDGTSVFSCNMILAMQ
jgi:3-hydroxyacyl-[acyl-carrier-protein] dehydratase